MLHLVTTNCVLPPHVPNVYEEITVDWSLVKVTYHISKSKDQFDQVLQFHNCNCGLFEG